MNALFDIELIRARKRRAKAGLVEGADFLMHRAADDLGDRLSTVGRTFSNAAAIGCVTQHAADALLASGKVADILRIETDGALLGGFPGETMGDERLLLSPHSIDLAVSLLTLHEVNDLPGMLIQIRRALRPDGLFLAAMAGGGTLAELSASLIAAETELHGGVTPRVSPFTDVRAAGGLLQRAGFALPVADIETVTVRYASMFSLMADLRAMGATNALAERSRRPATRALFARAAKYYEQHFADADGRIRATFDIVWMSGWAPDPSQQKPLKPGSAEVSLSKILGNR